ncbi:sodium/dicarboxylate symporter [Lactobacillus acetotolerans]|uniref:L-cystine uptake protein TcyP n=1 Tax=Lactobacillus acetotolerans TaxID=1600 RepID=A0A0D6A360_9LACO|nr:cation:dicarboxylase symporter family transporter [Lactobacillus acetotolerans]MBN7276528.1 cation:dicarboxylase symporter family transporter [Lactobacillus acetotolerans]BAQ57258.1 sodium/dicarboxylate symporter [Lactobacillus acetotolerans]
MNDNISTVIVVALAAIILIAIAYLQKKKVSFNKLVVIGLITGIVFGVGVQLIFGAKSKVATNATDWISIVGNGYISLLQMLVIPLILISLISAFTKLKTSEKFGKITGNILFFLLSTTAVAALIGFISVAVFHLQGAAFARGTASKDNLAFLQQHQNTLNKLSVPQKIVSLLPQNIFADLAGTRATSTIAVVIFSMLVGFAFMWLKDNKPDAAKVFASGTNALDQILGRIVKIIINLTPYGIFSLMTQTVAVNSIKTIEGLAIFIVAVYFALILVLIGHTIILLVNRINPITYYKKVWPTLLFAFTSRNSAGALPMNVETQTKKLGVDQAIADFSASLGLSIGQNGCAGIYPAMIATITAPIVGINIFSFKFILTLILVVTISSFGVAGSGGGATFASLIVLGTLNLPIGVMAIVLAIDPIVDMGRTAINVNDSILAGLITSKRMNLLDKKTLVKKQ